MKNKNTKKSQETASFIKRTFLKEIESKSYHDITVSELCKSAHINRGTFYLHFDSIQDILEKLEQDFFEEIKDKVEKVTMPYLNYDFFLAIIEVILKNETLSKLINADIDESDLLKKLLTYISSKFTTEFKTIYPDKPIEKIRLLLIFIIGGAADILKSWLHNGKKETKEFIAEVLDSFATALIDNFDNV